MFGLGVAFVTEPWLDTCMNNTATTAQNFADMIAAMADARRAHCPTATADEIAAHIKTSLLRMMTA